MSTHVVSTNPVAASSSSFWSSGVSTFGARSRPHDLGRMTVEGEARRVEVASVGEVAHEPQHRLVPEVHAVVRADRHDRARRGGVCPTRSVTTCITRVIRHDRPTTTAGFTPGP